MDDALRAIMAQSASAVTRAVDKAAGSYTAAKTDHEQFWRATGAATFNLTAAATLTSGWVLWVKGDGGAITIDPNSTELINGASTLTVPDGAAAFILCTGSAFRAILFGEVTSSGSQTLTNKTITQPTITLKQGSAPAPTDEGDIQWDTDDNVLVIGDGAAAQSFIPIPGSTAAGDVLYLSGAKAASRLAKGTAGQVLRMNSGATAPEWGAGNGAPDAVLEDQKTSGTSAGNGVSTTWTTRDLNTEVKDTYSLITLSSNQFTPSADGWVEWITPVYATTILSRLQNITDGTTVAMGVGGRADSGPNTGAFSSGGGAVVSGKAYAIQYYMASSGTNRLGQAFSLGTEVYTRVKYWRT
jgi:hypothetical protein